MSRPDSLCLDELLSYYYIYIYLFKTGKCILFTDIYRLYIKHIRFLIKYIENIEFYEKSYNFFII